MKTTPTKSILLGALPLRDGEFTIRRWTREDMESLAAWPDYPFPYHGFEFSFRTLNPAGMDEVFRTREEDPDLIVLVADSAGEPALGYFAPRMDWKNRVVVNFGLRVHPLRCDRGTGTAVLSTVCGWLQRCGIESVRVDVAASNARAVRCYEKAGFIRTGELWREARDLIGVDIGTSRYDFLRPHMRVEDEVPKLRFLLMERGQSGPGSA
jgi:ribosomal protein S18 acetylase RimI-like enzyme